MKNKNKFYIFIYIFLVFLLTFILTKNFLQKITPKINKIAEEKVYKFTYNIITDSVGSDILKNMDVNDILKITKNKEDEIILVDYDLAKAYYINNQITTKIKNNLECKESDDVKKVEDGLRIDIPLYAYSNYSILSNLGPKIPIKISFSSNIISNIKTKVTNYGLNNALTEVYVVFTITELIISPISNEEIKVDYDVLIASKMINGRVPTLYGNTYETNLDIPSN